MKFKVLGIIAFGIICFILGQLCPWPGANTKVETPKNGENPSGQPSNPNTALFKNLPDAPWVFMKSPGGAHVSVRRTKGLNLITSASVSNKNYNYVAAKFSEKTGQPTWIKVVRERMILREWGFRNDGTLEYEAIYDPEKSKVRRQVGEKTYYDRDGKVQRTEVTSITFVD